ncbi:hypothetical protein BSS2_I0828 [Brucella suis bv. 1 str. S2]|uniref:Uncharacterized protein n=3 Tax=Brucella TaxID=234 RepID=Q2YNJ1_BRUA2|nr:hypothetical protein BR0846 [Brucella suis 1330]AAX74225.1 hypothetical protein BruAb1_0859 [Brucella abortus bv. 1 str. 9-941]AEU05860.1 hypothetical protein BSVBI22_A0842 [Brucella suis VBI22]AHN46484.1 hypothetical protein BSS2_I0828 [Brucella suis bv. 1 str. S2]CAJ10822.1 conserved hypothetical protein [Brucella abortus 2308]CDL76249.1 unnamed protein product [Brucella canis str. Oliveri]
MEALFTSLRSANKLFIVRCPHPRMALEEGTKPL